MTTSLKILKKCWLPLTGVEVVDHIVTELAVIDVTPQGLVLRELAPDASLEQVQSLTEPSSCCRPAAQLRCRSATRILKAFSA